MISKGRRRARALGGAVGLVSMGACGGGAPPPATGDVASAAPASLHPVEVHRPYATLGMNTGRTDVLGRPERAPCGSCHHLVGPKAENEYALELREFHAGIALQHGDNTCRTCHAGPDFERFKLATGRTVDYAGVARLCAQCHAGQWKDYQHGAHGGMSGHWDRRVGPQMRNHCLDCHNAHAPAIPRFVPAPRPRARFLTAKGAGHE